MATSITYRPSEAGEITAGTPCLYVPAFNPVRYTLQRRDYEVLLIQDNGGNAELVFDASEGDVTSEFTIGDTVCFSSSLYSNMTSTVLAVSFASSATRVVIDETYAGSNDLGAYYLNNITAFPDFAVEIETFAGGASRGTVLLYPSPSGEINADISAFLKPQLSGETAIPYTATMFADTNPITTFYIDFREVDGRTTATTSDVSNSMFAVYASRQVGELSGNSMAGYTGVSATLGAADLPKFLTKFDQPTYYEGYPFSLDAILQTISPGFQYEIWESDGTASVRSFSPSTAGVQRFTLEGNYTSSTIDVKLQFEDPGGPQPP